MNEKRKTRSDSRLFHLTGEQQAQLHDWIATLGFPKARELLAASPPEGLGVKANLSSMHVFYLKYAADRLAETFAEAEKIKHPAPSKIFSLAERAVHAGAFQLSTSPIDTESFRELSRWVTDQQSTVLRREAVNLTQQSLALRQQRLAFDREKYELDVAKRALAHVPALQRIRHNNDLEDQARIRAARDEIFGPDPEHIKSTTAPLGIDPKCFPGGHNS